MTKREQARLVAWRVRVLQQGQTSNVARVCRRSGFRGSRSTSGSGDTPHPDEAFVVQTLRI
jgi:hypothetical protein